MNKDPRKAQPIPGYEVLERIGSGGMGTIFKARQLSMDRIVALKVLRKTDLKDALPLDRLRREALLIARMDHPNIVKGIDMGETERYYYFAMDFIEGRSVKDLIELHGPFGEYETARIVRDVAKALQYASEQKLTHRDIKPGNILISTQGQTKVTDLGLAKGESDLTITREGTTVGTPQYISPEQARNPKIADIRSDIFSLGATYYHMVTGRMPFAGETMAQVLTKVLFERPPLPETVRLGLSPGTSRVLSRMMAKDPARRYQTPGDLMDDLDVLIESLKDGSRELAAFIGMNWEDSQRSGLIRRKYVAIPAALVVVVLALVYFLSQSGGPNGNDESLSVRPVHELGTAYESGALKPTEALKRLRGLSPLVHEKEAEAIGLLTEEIETDIRGIMDEVARPASTRFERALAEGGLQDALTRFKRIASHDVQQALGGEITRLSPQLQSYWRAKLDEGHSILLAKIKEAHRRLEAEADAVLEERCKVLEGLLAEGRYDQAWKGCETLSSERKALYTQAAERYAATLPLAKPLEPARFIDTAGLEAFEGRVLDWCASFKQQISEAGRVAQASYLESVLDKAKSMVAEGDQALMESEPAGVIDMAVRELGKDPPRLPEGHVEVSSLEQEIALLLAARRSELEARHRKAYRETWSALIHDLLSQGDFDGALKQIREAKPGSEGEAAYLKQWGERIETLGSLEELALKGLDRFKGLDVHLKTERGARYQGRVQAVSLENGTVTLGLGSGRIATLELGNLAVEDVLDWCGKTQVLEPWCMGLYAFYRNDESLAEQYLKACPDFEEAPLYLARIETERAQAKTAQETAQGELDVLMDQADQALADGDSERGMSLLEECRRKYRSTPAWGPTRRRREALKKAFLNLEKEKEKQSRLSKLFSVPVEVLDNERVRVTYPFDAAEEMKDFASMGRAWHVVRGQLVCGEGVQDERPDFYHNQMGVRFGEAFDPKDPLLVSFDYQVPVEGKGPVFMVLSFFSGCLGIRSEGQGEGQVNFWEGDNEDYGDYFFVPDFGEYKPRKGRSQTFGFLRGERYRIELEWTPGRQLVLRIDDRDVYRAKAFSPDRSGLEIKTLRQAEIDNLSVEGVLK